MNGDTIDFINTRLQPGGEGVSIVEPFQRLASAGKTVETVLTAVSAITGLKPGVNEKVLLPCEI
jgi:hypothetical protein